MSPSVDKKKRGKKIGRQSGGALPTWLQNAMNNLFGLGGAAATTTIRPTTTVAPTVTIPSTTYSSAPPALIQAAPPGIPAGALVNSDGSIIDPVSGLILAGRGSTTAPIGSTVTSTGTIVPPVTSGAPIGAVSSTTPVGSIVLPDGSIRNRFTGAQVAGPGTTTAPAGSLVIAGGLIVAVASINAPILGTAPIGVPGGSIVNADGSITNPINGTIVAAAGTITPGTLVGNIVMRSGAIVAPNALTIASSAALRTLIATTTTIGTTTTIPNTTTIGLTGNTGNTGANQRLPVGVVAPGIYCQAIQSDSDPSAVRCFQIPINGAMASLDSTRGQLPVPGSAMGGYMTCTRISSDLDSTALRCVYSRPATNPNASTGPSITGSGLTGPTGPTGLQGMAGLIGTPGPTGPAGLIGVPGVTGPVGPSTKLGMPITFLVPPFTVSGGTVTKATSGRYAIKKTTQAVGAAGAYSNETVTPSIETSTGIFSKARCAINNGSRTSCIFGFTDTPSMSAPDVTYGFAVQSLTAADVGVSPNSSKLSIYWNRVSTPIDEGFSLTTVTPPQIYVTSTDVLLLSYDGVNFKFYVNGALVAKRAAAVTTQLHFSGFVYGTANTSIKEPAILDIEVGQYNLNTYFDVMLGGANMSKNNEQEGGGFVPDWLANAVSSATLAIQGRLPTAQGQSITLPNYTGSQGPTGPAGLIGVPGITGSRGPQGLTGPSGLPIIGIPLEFVTPNTTNTKLYTLYNAPNVPANRYTIQKVGQESTVAGVYTSTAVTPTASSGVFVMGRAIANGANTTATFGFTIADSTYPTTGAPPDLSSTSPTTVDYGFSIGPTTGIVAPNIDTMKILVIVGGSPIDPQTLFYGGSTPNTAVNISAADRLIVSYNGTNMTYFVNGVRIHQAPISPSYAVTVGTTKFYGSVTLENTSIPCSIVDFQMGNYDIASMPNFIIGGKRSNSLKKVRVEPMGKSKTKRLVR